MSSYLYEVPFEQRPELQTEVSREENKKPTNKSKIKVLQKVRAEQTGHSFELKSQCVYSMINKRSKGIK